METPGRKPLDEMTQDEKLDELLGFSRSLEDILAAASQNPMLSMMIPGGMPNVPNLGA